MQQHYSSSEVHVRYENDIGKMKQCKRSHAQASTEKCVFTESCAGLDFTNGSYLQGPVLQQIWNKKQKVASGKGTHAQKKTIYFK